MRSSLVLSSVLALAVAASAQSMYVLPSSAATTEGNSNNVFPWGYSNMRAQHIYDSSNIPSTGPILIQGLRVRADGGTSTWASGTIQNVVVKLSTCPVDYLAASGTFASNHGKDLATVYTGSATVVAGGGSTPQKGYYISIKFASNFLYDPAQGDLVIDVARGGVTGSQFRSDAVSGTGTTATRVYNTSSPTATTGTVGTAYGIVCAIDYVPAKGLYAGFSATPVSGKSPLKVQFSDKSYTSDAGGITKWEWDLNGDSKVDSTLQNPVYSYGASMFDTYFDVTLTVYDATHPKNGLTKKQFIRVNPSTASEEDFGKGTINKAAPSPMEMPDFTYTYTAGATRGYFFQAPVQMIINGFEVPNETKKPQQAILLFKYPGTTKPTGSYSVTAADHLFFTTTAKADTVVRPKAPIIVPKGTWLGVLGGCHTGSGSLSNSYGNGGDTTVLGQKTTLSRLTFGSLLTTNGIGSAGTSTSPVGRVWLHVVGNTSTKVPTLTSSARPILGTTPNLEFNGNIATAQGGVLFLGTGRMPSPVKTPFGDLLIQPPFGLSLPVANGKGSIPLPIPNSNNLKGVVLDWQGFVFDIAGGYWGMTNGTEWYVGSQN